MTMKIIGADEAASQIPNHATIAVSGGGYRVVPEMLLEAVASRFRATGEPSGLTAVCVSMLERTRGGRGGAATGLNRLAVEGLLTRLFCSSFSRAADREINQLIRAKAVAAHNYPMGTILQWLRAIGAGRPGLATPVGIGTFVDPRIEGGCAGAAAGEPFTRIVNVAGEEMIYYPRLPIDVALVKASAVDERGNLYVDREAYNHGLFDVALAARGSGGLVIAEVNRVVERGDVHPRMGRVPGAIVDAVVVGAPPWEDEQDPVLTGWPRAELDPPADLLRPRDLIARAVVDLVPMGAMVNLGAGIPMYDVPEAARRLGRADIYFTVEQGPMGGWPQVGGVSRNPDLILDQLDVFDLYEGGAPDLSVLAFGQFDRNGNVNVSRFGDMMPGCGGFINIVHGVRDLVFCGTLTTGKLQEAVGGGRLVIENEGRVQRFVEQVDQITFNGPRALAEGRRVRVVTERAQFEVTGKGFRVTALAPGVDLHADVLAHIPFPVAAEPEPPQMNPLFFQ